MQKIINIIEQYDTIIIHRHKSPDFDAIGSQMALKELIKFNYNEKNVYAVGDSGYDDFSVIGEVDKVSNSKFKNNLCIIVDTANKIRIEDDRFKTAEYVIKIDHHQIKEEDQYGDLNIVDPKMSSTCELLTTFIMDNDLKINSKIANYLYYGLYSDTGGFKFPSTSSNTLKCASFLRSFEWDFNQTMLNLNCKPLAFQKIIGYAYNNLIIEDNVGYLIFDKEKINELQFNNNQISQIVNYLGDIIELDKWVVFNEYDSFIRVNLRSRAEYDISKVANKYDGGGHKNASGASIYDKETIKSVIEDLKNLDRE